MRFDFDQTISTIDGEPVYLTNEQAEAKDVPTFGAICVQALLNANETAMGPQGLVVKPQSAEQKFTRFNLALKLKEGGIIEIDDDERALLKNVFGFAFAIEVMGQLYKALDNPVTVEVVKTGTGNGNGKKKRK